MKPNVDALRAIREMVVKHPEHFVMDTWFREVQVDADGYDDRLDYGLADLTALPTVDDFVLTCGTSACIAGWAMLLYRQELPDHPHESDVIKLLGVRGALFYEDEWPELYQGYEPLAERAALLLEDLADGVEVWS